MLRRPRRTAVDADQHPATDLSELVIELVAAAPEGRRAFSGTSFGVRVRVRRLPAHWLTSTEPMPLHLCYHWKSLSGELVCWDGLRTPLPLHAGASVVVDLLVHVPNLIGLHLLELTGLCEGQWWWDDHGFNPLQMQVSLEPLLCGTNTLLIAGGAGFRNVGDEALLRSAAQLCGQLVPQSKLLISANNPRVAVETLAGLPVCLVSSLRIAFFRGDQHYNLCDDVFLRRWADIDRVLGGASAESMIDDVRSCPSLDFIDRTAAEQFIRALAAASLLLIHGGGILTSMTRSRLWEMALLCRLAHSLSVRIALRSQQIGPFIGQEDVELARRMFDQADFVSTRDSGQSWFTAVATGTRTCIQEDVDDAFILEKSGLAGDGWNADWGLQRKSYVCGCFRRNPSVGISEVAVQVFIDTLEYAAARSGKLIVLLPMGPFDVDVLQHIQSRLLALSRLIIPRDWMAEATIIAQQAIFVISLPHHPLIFALQAGTPIISPVEGNYYSAKNRGSMRWFGLEYYVIDVQQTDAIQALKDRVDLLVDQEAAVGAHLARKIAGLELAGRESRNQFRQFLGVDREQDIPQ